MASCLHRKPIGFHLEVQGLPISGLTSPDPCHIAMSSSSPSSSHDASPPTHEGNATMHTQPASKEPADTSIHAYRSNEAYQSKLTADIRSKRGHKNPQPKTQLSAQPEVLNDKPLTATKAILHSRIRIECFSTTQNPNPLIEYGIPSLIPTSRSVVRSRYVHHDNKTDTATVNPDDKAINTAERVYVSNNEVIALTKTVPAQPGTVVTVTGHTPRRGRRSDGEPVLASFDLPVISLSPETSKVEQPSLTENYTLLMNTEEFAGHSVNHQGSPTCFTEDDLVRKSRTVNDMTNEEDSQNVTLESFDHVHGAIDTHSKRSTRLGLIATRDLRRIPNEPNAAAYEHQDIKPDPDKAVLEQCRLAVDDVQVAERDGLETTPGVEIISQYYSLSKIRSEEREHRENGDLDRSRRMCKEVEKVDSCYRHCNNMNATKGIHSSARAIHSSNSASTNATNGDMIRSKNSKENYRIETPILHQSPVSISSRFSQAGDFGQQVDQLINLERTSSELLCQSECHDVKSSLKEPAHDSSVTAIQKISPGHSKSPSKVHFGFRNSNSSYCASNRHRAQSKNDFDLRLSHDLSKNVSDDCKNINVNDPNILRSSREHDIQERKNGNSTLDNAPVKYVALETTDSVCSTRTLNTENSHVSGLENPYSDVISNGSTPFKHQCEEEIEPLADGATPFTQQDPHMLAEQTDIISQPCENKISSSYSPKGGNKKTGSYEPPGSVKSARYLWLPLSEQLPECSQDGCAMAEPIKLLIPESEEVKENEDPKEKAQRQRLNRFNVNLRPLKMPQRKSVTMVENKTKVSATRLIGKTKSNPGRPVKLDSPHSFNAEKVTDRATYSVNGSLENNNYLLMGSNLDHANSHYKYESAVSKLINSEGSVGNALPNSCLERNESDNQSGMRQSPLELNDKSYRNTSLADAIVLPKIIQKMPISFNGLSLQDMDFTRDIESQAILPDDSPSAAEDSNVFAIYESQSKRGLGKGVAQNENKFISRRLTSSIRTPSPEGESRQNGNPIEKSCPGSAVNSNELFRINTHLPKSPSLLKCSSSLREFDKRLFSLSKGQSDRLNSAPRIRSVNAEENYLLRSKCNIEDETTRLSIDDVIPYHSTATLPSVREPDKISFTDKSSTSITDFGEEAQESSACINVSISTCRSDTNTMVSRRVDCVNVGSSSSVLPDSGCTDSKIHTEKTTSVPMSSSADSFSAPTSKISSDVVESVDSLRPGSNTVNKINARRLCSLPRSCLWPKRPSSSKCDVQPLIDKVSTTMVDCQAISNHDIDGDQGRQNMEAEEQSSCFQGISVNIEYRPSTCPDSRIFNGRNPYTLKTTSPSGLLTEKDCDREMYTHSNGINAKSQRHSPDHHDSDAKRINKRYLTLEELIRWSEEFRSRPCNAKGDYGCADPGGMNTLGNLHRDYANQLMQLRHGQLTGNNGWRPVPVKRSPLMSSFDVLVLGHSLCGGDTHIVSMTDSTLASKHQEFLKKWNIDFRGPGARMMMKAKGKVISRKTMRHANLRNKLYLKIGPPPYVECSKSGFAVDNFHVKGHGMTTAGTRRVGSLNLDVSINQGKRNQMDDFDFLYFRNTHCEA